MEKCEHGFCNLEIFQDMIAKDNQFLKLIARIDLTPIQAAFILNGRDQEDVHTKMICRLSELPKWSWEELTENILLNPYILYEETRLAPQDYIIGINQLDLAFFPPEKFAAAWFDENDVRIDEGTDKRRIRALITSFLEAQAEKGNTFAPRSNAIKYCADFRKDLPDMDLGKVMIHSRSLEINKNFFNPLFIQEDLTVVTDVGEARQPILKLTRLEEVDAVIRKEVDRRLKLPPLKVSESDWQAIYNDIFGKTENDKLRESRAEQIKAIEKMAVSPLSVLTGGAGTGKTTALRVLCHNESIRNGGILILTPTGKARVVLGSELQKDGIAHKAQTVFAFLLGKGACDTVTYKYYLSQKSPEKNFPATVIIDESSMLTEEMMGALLQNLTHAKRIIFAGDPNQLPPIGAGKPFFELCEKLDQKSEMQLSGDKKVPAVDNPNFSCLQIKNRNVSLIGDIFKREGKSIDNEEMMAILKNSDNTFKLLPCADPEEMEIIVKEALTDVFDCLEGKNENKAESESTPGNDQVKKAYKEAQDALGKDPGDKLRFDLSLGGELSEDYKDIKWVNFNDPAGIENWQILSPWWCKDFYGTISLNQSIHGDYAVGEERDENIRKKKTKQSLGDANIIYGEKVINLKNINWEEEDIYSPEGNQLANCPKYTANGEIGIVGRLFSPKKGAKNIYHQVQFASQPGYLYKYASKSGGDESDPDLSLAYALTVHKAQGSGFGYTIFVLMDEGNRPSPFLSREMLYTAMTRQKQKLIIITNRKPEELLEYCKFSELEKRLTNLFSTRMFLKEDGGWYDERLIHRAKDGQKLRSKSELVIYQELLNAGFSPAYETSLEWEDGQAMPDFTLEGKDGPIYWEHLGMLGNRGYAAHWQDKKALYAKHGISEEAGNLIISEDNKYTGALDMEKIMAKIEGIKQRN